jgi:hypothetical protein
MISNTVITVAELSLIVFLIGAIDANERERKIPLYTS